MQKIAILMCVLVMSAYAQCNREGIQLMEVSLPIVGLLAIVSIRCRTNEKPVRIIRSCFGISNHENDSVKALPFMGYGPTQPPLLHLVPLTAPSFKRKLNCSMICKITGHQRPKLPPAMSSSGSINGKPTERITLQFCSNSNQKAFRGQ